MTTARYHTCLVANISTQSWSHGLKGSTNGYLSCSLVLKKNSYYCYGGINLLLCPKLCCYIVVTIFNCKLLVILSGFLPLGKPVHLHRPTPYLHLYEMKPKIRWTPWGECVHFDTLAGSSVSLSQLVLLYVLAIFPLVYCNIEPKCILFFKNLSWSPNTNCPLMCIRTQMTTTETLLGQALSSY